MFLGIKDFVEGTNGSHPLALEDALYQIVLDALQKNDCVIVDDIHVSHRRDERVPFLSSRGIPGFAHDRTRRLCGGIGQDYDPRQ